VLDQSVDLVAGGPRRPPASGHREEKALFPLEMVLHGNNRRQ